MKKPNLSITILILSILFLSCFNDAQDNNQNDIEVTNQTDEEKIDHLFENIDVAISDKLTALNAVAKKSDSELAITFLVIKDNTSGNITLANFETENIFPLPNSLFSKSSGDEFTVSCSGGSGGDWTESCGGKFSCGSKIAKCLDEGGCASICKAPEQIRLNAEDFLGIGKIEKADFNLENISVVKIAFTN